MYIFGGGSIDVFQGDREDIGLICFILSFVSLKIVFVFKIVWVRDKGLVKFKDKSIENLYNNLEAKLYYYIDIMVYYQRSQIKRF